MRFGGGDKGSWRRGSLYGAVFIGVMALAALFGNAWHESDWLVYESLAKTEPAPISDDLVLLDLDDAQTSLADFRRHLAAVLTAMNGDGTRPRILVLDIAVQSARDQVDALTRAVAALQEKGTAVFAAVSPIDQNGSLDPDYMSAHARDFYAQLDGRGHTLFDYHSVTPSYRPVLSLAGELGEETLLSLPDLIADRSLHRSAAVSSPPVILDIGARSQVARHLLISSPQGLVDSARRAVPNSALNGKLVVVGDRAKDRTGFLGLAGPDVLLMAINAKLLPADRSSQPKILTSDGLLVGFCLLEAGSAILLLQLFQWKSRRWRGHPGLLALLSIPLAWTLLAAIIFALWGLGLVAAQVTLPALAAPIAAGLGWHAATERRKLALIAPELDSKEEAEDRYDIFISYSHDPANADWVRDHVHGPLAADRSALGRPLRIFFDQDNKNAIKGGSSWFAKLARSIQGSGVFVPIYSEDYFAKNYCRWEMERAAIRHVADPGFVFPLARGKSFELPVEFDNIHYVDVERDSDFIARLLDHVRARAGGS